MPRAVVSNPSRGLDRTVGSSFLFRGKCSSELLSHLAEITEPLGAPFDSEALSSFDFVH